MNKRQWRRNRHRLALVKVAELSRLMGYGEGYGAGYRRGCEMWRLMAAGGPEAALTEPLRDIERFITAEMVKIPQPPRLLTK